MGLKWRNDQDEGFIITLSIGGDDHIYILILFIVGNAYAYDDTSSSSDSDDEILKRYQETLKHRGSIQRSDTKQSISSLQNGGAKRKSTWILRFSLCMYCFSLLGLFWCQVAKKWYSQILYLISSWTFQAQNQINVGPYWFWFVCLSV